MDCLFCQIAQGTAPATICYQDDLIIAFDDISPNAPQHKLIIPRQHIATLNELQPEHNVLIGKLYQVAKQLAHELNIANSGYRVVMNCNQNAGQTIFHIHAHLLGGSTLRQSLG